MVIVKLSSFLCICQTGNESSLSRNISLTNPFYRITFYGFLPRTLSIGGGWLTTIRLSEKWIDEITRAYCNVQCSTFHYYPKTLVHYLHQGLPHFYSGLLLIYQSICLVIPFIEWSSAAFTFRNHVGVQYRLPATSLALQHAQSPPRVWTRQRFF